MLKYSRPSTNSLKRSNIIIRKKSVSKDITKLWNIIKINKLAGKLLERVRGFFNYYLNFLGDFHAVVNKILLKADKRPYEYIIHKLIKEDTISFKSKPTFKKLK